LIDLIIAQITVKVKKIRTGIYMIFGVWFAGNCCRLRFVDLLYRFAGFTGWTYAPISLMAGRRGEGSENGMDASEHPYRGRHRINSVAGD